MNYALNSQILNSLFIYTVNRDQTKEFIFTWSTCRRSLMKRVQENAIRGKARTVTTLEEAICFF